jgi:two-component system CheB/CheR fusion protein
VLDRDLRVQIWNHKTEDYWGVNANETLGQHFLNLDIGLPVEQLRLCIRNCLQGISDPVNEVTLAAIDRRGRSLQCHVSCTPLMGDKQDVQGVILLMEAQPK